MRLLNRIVASFFGSRLWRAAVVLFWLAVLASADFDLSGIAVVLLICVGMLGISYAAANWNRREKLKPYQPRVPTRAVKRLRPVPLVSYHREPLHAGSNAEFPDMAMQLPPKLNMLVMRGLSEQLTDRDSSAGQ